MLLALPLLLGLGTSCDAPRDVPRATRRGVEPLPEEPPARPRDGRLNIVLVVMDSLRRDHLGIHSSRNSTSPHIDAMAKTALVFDHAYSPVNWTAPSMASIFTGTHQSVHGVTHRLTESRALSVLDSKFTTLAETLQQAGYATAAFSSQAWILPQTGFAQGFDRFVTVSSIKDIHEAERVIGAGTSWMEAHQKNLFFVYLHVLNPHSPYTPPPPFDRSFWQSPVPAQMQPLLGLGIDEHWSFLTGLARPAGVQPVEEDVLWLQSQYDGEILYVDWLLGQLFRKLDDWQLTEQTLVVLTSDHGEHFGEHGIFGHARHVYNPVLAVPLILSNPKLFSRQKRISEPVQSIDLYPTLVEVADASRPPQLQGHSLLSGELDGVAYSEGAVHSHYKLQDARWSFIEAADGTVSLYDRAADPEELKDQSLTRPEVVADMRAKLASIHAANRAHPLRVERSAATSVDPAVIDQLRALGYVGAD
jgi:arylsulfatase A-like enzyme